MVFEPKKAFEPQRRRPSLQLSPKGGEGDCFPSRKREGIEGRAERKGKTMCYRNLPGHRIGEYQMDFMSLFCELGDKAAHPCEPHFFAPSRLCD